MRCDVRYMRWYSLLFPVLPMTVWMYLLYNTWYWCYCFLFIIFCINDCEYLWIILFLREFMHAIYFHVMHPLTYLFQKVIWDEKRADVQVFRSLLNNTIPNHAFRRMAAEADVRWAHKASGRIWGRELARNA